MIVKSREIRVHGIFLFDSEWPSFEYVLQVNITGNIQADPESNSDTKVGVETRGNNVI